MWPASAILLARLAGADQPLGRPIGIDEDTRGCRVVLGALGPPPILVVMEKTGHHCKNLHPTLPAAGHDAVPLNPTVARRFQYAGLARIRTDASDAMALARFAFEKRPAPSYLHDAACESLRELMRHRDWLKQDFEDRVQPSLTPSLIVSSTTPIGSNLSEKACEKPPPATHA
jgi:transposase